MTIDPLPERPAGAFSKQNPGDDLAFYAPPRLVTHIDEGAVAALTACYRDASITDQLRVCRAHADRQGWHIVEEYTDHAISGASLLRPGIRAMIADAVSDRFQVVLAEAMDRLSRDQEVSQACSSACRMAT